MLTNRANSPFREAAREAMAKLGEARWRMWTRKAHAPETIRKGERAARPSQIPHPTKTTTFFRGGRGSGKSASAIEWLCHRICTEVGTYGLVGPWLDLLITEFLEEGIYKIIPPAFRHWRGSINQVDFANGSRLRLFHAERKGKVRGPNLMGAVIEEPADMRFGMDAWTNTNLALRIQRPNGLPPQCYVTGTPARVELIEHVLEQVDNHPNDYHLATGSMYDNIHNLDPRRVALLKAMYEGSNLGDQELLGLMIEDVEGALMTTGQIRAHRQDVMTLGSSIKVMSIDPGFSSSPTADEVGIIIGQRIGTGMHAIAEVLEDCSTRGTPGKWATYLPDKCDEWGVDVIVYESNMTGQWLRETLDGAFKGRDRKPRMEPVSSKKSKWARAEPVAALAQKGRYRHVGTFGRLESELTSWVPDTGQRSPNRLDAWAQLGRFLLISNIAQGGLGKRPTKRVPRL